MFPGMNMNANFQGNNDPNKAQMNVNMGMPGMGMPGMQMNINAQGPNPGGFQQYPGYQPQPQPQPQYSQQYPPQYGGPQNVQANIGIPGMPGMGINMQVSGQPQNYGQPQNNFGQFPQQPQYPNQYPQQYPGNPQNVQANIGFPGMGMGINMEVKGQGFGQPGFNQPMQPMQPMQPGMYQPGMQPMQPGYMQPRPQMMMQPGFVQPGYMQPQVMIQPKPVVMMQPQPQVIIQPGMPMYMPGANPSCPKCRGSGRSKKGKPCKRCFHH